MDLLSHSPWISATIIILGIFLLVVGPYAVTRSLLHRRADTETETLAGSVVFRIASLHGLILALVFAQEQINYVNLRTAILNEASSVADLFFDMERYGVEATLPLRRTVAEYVDEVLENEWSELATGQLSSVAWGHWDAAYQGVLNLVPENLRQESLRASMLEDIDEISDRRNERQEDASSGVITLFWVVAVSGVVLVVLPYFVFRARFINLFLLGVFAVYNGIVIYMIAAMSNPYSAPAVIQPTPFIHVQEQITAALDKAD